MRKEAEGAAARKEARVAPGLQFTTQLFHGKMEHSAPSARRGEVGEPFDLVWERRRGCSHRNPGRLEPRYGNRSRLASRPLAVGRPLSQCSGAPGLVGANQRTDPKFGGGARWGCPGVESRGRIAPRLEERRVLFLREAES